VLRLLLALNVANNIIVKNKEKLNRLKRETQKLVINVKSYLTAILSLILGIPHAVYFLVLMEGSSGNEAFPASGAGERSIAGMQPAVKLVARLVRKRLVADVADEAFCGGVDRVDVVFEVRRGEVGFAAGLALVRASAGVFQHVQLQAVVEVKLRPALAACVWFPGAVQRTLVMVQCAGRRERLLAFVAGNPRFSNTVVASYVPLKGALCRALVTADSAREAGPGMHCVTMRLQYLNVGERFAARRTRIAVNSDHMLFQLF